MKHKIRSRPDRSELVRMHILEGNNFISTCFMWECRHFFLFPFNNFYPTGWHPPNWIATWRPKVMLGTWERSDSPNNLLMDGLFPTSWYHRCLSYCLGKTFQSRGFLLQRGTCAHSLSHKGYNGHRSNHRFPCYVCLLQCPHLTWLLCCYLPTIVQLDLTIILNTLHSAQQIFSIWPHHLWSW